MPKIVDHDQRRAEIVRIIIKVIAEDGLNNATVRTISRRGGFSSGVISHYFTNKDEMIRFAFDAVADSAAMRTEKRLVAEKGIGRVRAIIEEHVPVGKNRDEAAVAIAFWEMAIHDQALRKVFRAKYDRWRGFLRRELQNLLNGVDDEEIERRVDLAVSASDGLMVRLAIDGRRSLLEDRGQAINFLISTLGVSEA
ncbi:MAG: TetR family transcriptional regulator C-terminal domain-containing protein [Pseudomonadota bacterium]